jgi:hypothetical protein
MTRELNLGQMRQLMVLIQNGKTSDYLKADDSWTTDISQALHFPDIETAFSHMRKCGLPHLQVFVIPAQTKSKNSSD